MPQIIDAFLFAGELDILEIRLNELNSLVDHFVIVESCEPHGASGWREPVYLANPERWAEIVSKFGNKIRYNCLPKLEPAYTDAKSGWERENYHRQALLPPIEFISTSPDDVVIVSDVDEIPRASALKAAIPHLKDFPIYLKLDMFMFNVNSYLDEMWFMSYMCTVKTLLAAGGPQAPRGHLDQTKPSGTYPGVGNGGWHFSSFMNLRRLREKLRTFAHSSDFPGLLEMSDAALARLILTPRNIFTHRLLENRSSNDARLPQHFLDNLEKFKGLTRELLDELYPAPDVTIGVIRDMDWPTLAPYANSLARCGFKGLKVMLVENEPEEVIQNLQQLGFAVLHRPPTPHLEQDGVLPESWSYGYHRFGPVVSFLKNNRFRYVIWTDVRDVVFQADPIPYLEAIFPTQIVFAGLSHISAGCPYNDVWIRHAAQSDQVWEEVRQQETLACGTFAGTYDAMLSLIQDTHEGCLAQPGTVDQGMFNYLARTAYKEVVHVSQVQEPFSAQWWDSKRLTANPPISTHSYPQDPVFDEVLGEVRTATGELYPIVHLYDRSTKWVQIMKEKYA